MNRGAFPFEAFDLISGIKKATFLQPVCNDDWNLKIEYGPYCVPEDPQGSIYCLSDFKPVTWVKSKSVVTDGYGKEVEVYKTSKQIFSFEFYTEIGSERRVSQIFDLSAVLKLTWRETAATLQIRNHSISLKPVNDDYLLATVTYESDDSNAGPWALTVCCDSIYDDDPGPGPDPDPYNCALMLADLSRTGTAINLTVSGAPSAINTVWKFTPAGGGATITIATNVSGVTATGYGVYSVIVTSGICTKSVSVEYLDPCSGFEVTVINDGTGLNASSGTYVVTTWLVEYSLDGLAWSTVGSSNSYAATDTGFYRFTGTTGAGCTDSYIIFVDAADLCSFEGEITADGNALTWTPTVMGDYTYVWYMDTGSGFVLIPGETLDTYTATETAVYKVIVTNGDDCITEFTKLHIMCSDCAAFAATVTHTGDDIDVDTTGCGTPDYYWYKINGDGSKSEVGSNLPMYTLPENGGYFLAVCCPGCETLVYIITKSGATIVITDNRLNDQIAWGG